MAAADLGGCAPRTGCAEGGVTEDGEGEGKGPSAHSEKPVDAFWAAASSWGFNPGSRQEGEEGVKEKAEDLGRGTKGAILIALLWKAHHLHLLCRNSWGS